MPLKQTITVMTCCAFLLVTKPVGAVDGAKIVAFYGYDNCIELSNSSAQVILCPAAGGRVLSYALNGKNVLYLPSGDEGWRWDGTSANGPMHAGRFDIGPEQVVPRRPVLWQGEWQGKLLVIAAAHTALASR
ncbi:MAG: hypothetical protein R3C53_17760 [Pirellulaceae bacterium]